MSVVVDGIGYFDASHAKACRRLREYYASFPARSRAVLAAAAEMNRAWRERSPEQVAADERTETAAYVAEYLRRHRLVFDCYGGLTSAPPDHFRGAEDQLDLECEAEEQRVTVGRLLRGR
jgi:hypothetical protein